ncbi:hypothetical protein [Cohnella sp. GCM10027633]|uniref:hypothetical protein n=1 Tax=unclassified Cohnella TaxID=2636738 RepID=UPI0036272571
MKIEKALYKSGDIQKPIAASLLTKDLYEAEYRKKLFCTESGCKTLLSFVERKDTESKFFKTWPKKVHKEGCKNAVEYSDNEGAGATNTEEESKYRPSSKQIRDKLKRAYESYTKKPEHSEDSTTNVPHNHYGGSEASGDSGAATLASDAVEKDTGKGPYIYTRLFDALSEADLREVRCVIGQVRSMYVFDDYAYINLTPKQQGSVKIRFQPDFVANNKTEFAQFELFKKYVNLKRSLKEEVICCCIGTIKKANLGYNIEPDSYINFTFNGMGYYEIIEDYNRILGAKASKHA